MSEFNYSKFLADRFGSPERLVAFLGSYVANSPPRATVNKWFSRAQIPSGWFALLLALLELEDGTPVRLAPYLGVPR